MKNIHRKREFIFWGTGIVLLIIVVVFLIYSIGFLVNNSSGILGKDFTKDTSITRFNLDGLEKLGLTQEQTQ